MPHADPVQKREAEARWRQENPDAYKAIRQRSDAKIYATKTQMVHEYKVARGCEDCGDRDPIVLDLHHHEDDKHPRLRTGSASNLQGLSYLDLFYELMKGTVLCSNDHRRRHAHARAT